MARINSSTYPALVNESVVSKLNSAGIFTTYDFMLYQCDELMKKTGLTFKQIEEIRDYFSTKFAWEMTSTGDLFEREFKPRISTGIQNLDALLGDGLRCGAIYEICGSSSAGKSQLCHWLSMHATSNDSVMVHYIDASRNLCLSRIGMMLQSKDCDNGTIGRVMTRIKVYQICKIYELFSVLHRLSNVADKDQGESSKSLIIIDSLSVLCAIVSSANLNPLLCHVASMCRHIVNHLEAAIVIVNTVRSKQEGTFLSLDTEQKTEKNFTITIRPSLGKYWLDVPNVRLLMTQEENGERKIAVWKSRQLEDGKSCLVNIRDEGVVQS